MTHKELSLIVISKLKDASDDGQANVDFSIKMELTADESYYLGVDYYLDIEEGKIT